MSGIEWCDRSDWNCIRGCTRVSDGCTSCYAEAIAGRFSGPGQPFHGFAKRTPAGARWTGKVELIAARLTLPLKWRKPARIFVNSAYDLFHESIPDVWIDRVFAVMALCPQHTFQVLTKRSKRMRAWFEEKWQGTPAQTMSFSDGTSIDIPAGKPTGRRSQVEQECEPLLQQFGLADTARDELWTEDDKCKAMQWRWPLPNVWLGVSAEDQPRADERIPDLLATPAAVRFVSGEPMLGLINPARIAHAGRWIDAFTGLDEKGIAHFDNGIDWVIAGGESGPDARPMHPDWARSLRDQCVAAGVAFHFKQWGEWLPWEPEHGPCWVAQDGRSEDHHVLFPVNFDEDQRWDDGLWAIDGKVGHAAFQRVGKKRAGRLLDGREWNEFPNRKEAT